MARRRLDDDRQRGSTMASRLLYDRARRDDPNHQRRHYYRHLSLLQQWEKPSPCRRGQDRWNVQYLPHVEGQIPARADETVFLLGMACMYFNYFILWCAEKHFTRASRGECTIRTLHFFKVKPKFFLESDLPYLEAHICCSDGTFYIYIIFVLKGMKEGKSINYREVLDFFLRK